MPKKNIFADLSPQDLKKLKKITQPDFIQPMLATLTKDYFSSSDWIYEHKFDGVRCLAFKKKGKVRLMSRNNHTMNAEYPELVKALEAQKADDFIIDGEIIALDKKGVSDFQLLQSRMNLKNSDAVKLHETKTPIYYRIFDIMYVDGYDTRDLPLLARKSILEKLLNYTKMLTYSDHRSPNGIAYFKEACKKHWEGLIAKRSDSVYTGTRSPSWLKFKCVVGQELVIGGYTQPKGSRSDFGALLVGYYQDGKLMYAGKVGTGYSEDVLNFLGKKLRAREVKTCPFSNYTESTAGVYWVKPNLVGEFKFAQWTQANKLRVGRYQGLREDKDAKDVVKETAKK
jgi:DNA ligase D-like protein (predicted ligase)